MIDWLQKPSTLIWGIYLAAAELGSNFPSYSFSCILVSDEDHAKDYSGNQPCATMHEAVLRFLRFIWVNANHDNINAFAAVAVAVFTFTLWRSTLKLWETGEKQIAVADKAANAAKQSADVAKQALYGTEAPFIFIIITRADGKPVISPRGVESPEDVYTFHNYGRSPAIIREIYIARIASDVIPSPCPFPPLQTNLFQSEIVGPGDFSEPKPLPQIASFLPNDGKSHPGAAVVVCGQVRYADVFGNQYLSGFCYAFNSYFNRFHAIGGANQNYRRKLTEDENREAEKRDIIPSLNKG